MFLYFKLIKWRIRKKYERGLTNGEKEERARADADGNFTRGEGEDNGNQMGTQFERRISLPHFKSLGRTDRGSKKDWANFD